MILLSQQITWDLNEQLCNITFVHGSLKALELSVLTHEFPPMINARVQRPSQQVQVLA